MATTRLSVAFCAFVRVCDCVLPSLIDFFTISVTHQMDAILSFHTRAHIPTTER